MKKTREQARIDAAVVRQARAADKRSVRRHGRKCERIMQVDTDLFLNGIEYGRRHGVDNAWNEPDFVKECCERHPFIALEGYDGKDTSGGSGASDYMLREARRMLERTSEGVSV